MDSKRREDRLIMAIVAFVLVLFALIGILAFSGPDDSRSPSSAPSKVDCSRAAYGAGSPPLSARMPSCQLG
jgi:hypothetical protein